MSSPALILAPLTALLQRAVEDYRDKGTLPPTATNGALYRGTRGGYFVAEAGLDWEAGSRGLRLTPGRNPGHGEHFQSPALYQIIKSSPAPSANALKSRSLVSSGTPRSRQLCAISASPSRRWRRAVWSQALKVPAS